jgi:hypothetical protein
MIVCPVSFAWYIKFSTVVLDFSSAHDLFASHCNPRINNKNEGAMMQTTDSYREGWRSYPRSRSRCSSPRDERCSPPERCPATPGGPDAGTILRFSRSSLNLASIFRSSWYPKCIYTTNISKQQERKRKPLDGLYHQNGPQDDGQSLTRTNRHRTRRRRVAFDVPRLPRYPWVVAVLSGNKGNP